MSQVYGSEPCRARSLRQLSGGRLRVLHHPDSPDVFKPLMPRQEKKKKEGLYCISERIWNIIVSGIDL